MFLRLRLPSPPTPNIYFSPSLRCLSSSSKIYSDQNHSCAIPSLCFFSSLKSQAPFSPTFNQRQSSCGLVRSRCTLRFCRATVGSESSGPDVSDDDDSDQYIQALLLAPETIRHYNLWKQGFIEETKWHSAAQKYPFSIHRRGVDFNLHSIRHGFLRRFQSPTVFLKIACDGDLLLPIIVGEFAIIRLIDVFAGEEHEEYPDQFQFVKNIVRTFGYEVKMVRITNRVVNTYYARIYLRKAEDNTNISIDARPSDALNVAERFKAPIYVNKEIVVKDAIKVVYGNSRTRSTKMVYDISLDSAPEEPDPLIEEFDLVLNMNKAVQEERFEDAVLWRDKLMKLRMPRQEL